MPSYLIYVKIKQSKLSQWTLCERTPHWGNVWWNFPTCVKLGITVFNALYPEENRIRLEIQEYVSSSNEHQIKALSDLRYCKRTFTNMAMLQHYKWLVPINVLIDLTQWKSDISENLREYKEIVTIIADQAIKIEQTRAIEN